MVGIRRIRRLLPGLDGVSRPMAEYMAGVNISTRQKGVRTAIAGAAAVVFLVAAYAVVFCWPDGGGSPGDTGASAGSGAEPGASDAGKSLADLSSSSQPPKAPEEKPSTAKRSQAADPKTDVALAKTSAGSPTRPATSSGLSEKSTEVLSKTVPTAKQDVPTDRPAAQAAAKSEEPAAREPSVTTQFFRSLRREIWMLDVQISTNTRHPKVAARNARLFIEYHPRLRHGKTPCRYGSATWRRRQLIRRPNYPPNATKPTPRCQRCHGVVGWIER